MGKWCVLVLSNTKLFQLTDIDLARGKYSVRTKERTECKPLGQVEHISKPGCEGGDIEMISRDDPPKII